MSGIVGTSHSKSKVIGRSQDTAKAWVHYNHGSNNVEDSFGISSVSDVTTGHLRANFSTAFGNNSYSAVCSSRHANNDDTVVAGFDQRRTIATYTGYVSVMTGTEAGSGTAYDHDPVMIIVFGD